MSNIESEKDQSAEKDVIKLLHAIIVPNKWQVFIAILAAITLMSQYYFTMVQHDLDVELQKEKYLQEERLLKEKNAQVRELGKEENAQLRELAKEQNAQIRGLAKAENLLARELAKEQNAQTRELAKAENAQARELAKEENAQARELAREFNAQQRHISDIGKSNERRLKEIKELIEDNYTNQKILLNSKIDVFELEISRLKEYIKETNGSVLSQCADKRTHKDESLEDIKDRVNNIERLIEDLIPVQRLQIPKQYTDTPHDQLSQGNKNPGENTIIEEIALETPESLNRKNELEGTLVIENPSPASKSDLE